MVKFDVDVATCAATRLTLHLSDASERFTERTDSNPVIVLTVQGLSNVSGGKFAVRQNYPLPRLVARLLS
jgi:hypothetical protein